MAPPPAPPAVLAGAAPNTLVCEALLPEVLEESPFLGGQAEPKKYACLVQLRARAEHSQTASYSFLAVQHYSVISIRVF